ncbi:MAG: 4a-hydroxytetrahydrobiopterin dehydratase [Bryobacteraceae bacterium]
MARQKLDEEELRSALEELPAWTVKADKLHREYKFADFPHAFGFMATAAVLIEKINHHPEWLNVYNRVSVDLTTHDSGGITNKDVELARLLDGIAREKE